jgi:hypothetical protein
LLDTEKTGYDKVWENGYYFIYYLDDEDYGGWYLGFSTDVA